jgi:multiple sugar transport system ATP-binding protein
VRDGDTLVVRFGPHRLAVDPGLVAERPALQGFVDRDVVLGIRPEDLADVALGVDPPTDRRLEVTVDLREALGSEVLVHFPADATTVITDDERELADDPDADVQRSLFVARLDPRTRAEEGETVTLAVDTARVHFFDPSDGSSIR